MANSIRSLRITWFTIQALLGLTCIGHPSLAQDESSVAPERTAPKHSFLEAGSRVIQSFSDAVAQSPRSRFGFSAGAFEIYSSNMSSSDVLPTHAKITFVSPRLFANFGGNKSRIHLDYGLGYRIYNDQRNLDSMEHSGNLSCDLQIARRVNVKFSDHVFSSTNDFASPFSPVIAIPSGRNVFSYVPFLDRRRTVQNTLNGALHFTLGRKSSLGFFSSYRINRHDAGEFTGVDSDGVLAGVSYEYRLAKWLSLSSSYSTYLNDVDERFYDSRTTRLEFGAFHFKLGRNWDLEIAAGADMVDVRSYSRRFEWNYRQRFSRFSRSNNLFFSYQHDFRSASTVSRLFRSDSVAAGLGQRLTRQLTFRASGFYTYSKEAFGAGTLKSYAGISALEFAVGPNIIATLSYGYQLQKNTIPISPNFLNVDRHVAYIGLQYLWPSSRAGKEVLENNK